MPPIDFADGSSLDTAQLLAFDRIVRERSFGRAARALGIAQPTISGRVRALERAVGGALFARVGRGVQLTDLGASFLPYARRALEVLDAGVEAARQSQAGERGRVSLGVLESLSGAFLGPLLADFTAAHPLVDVVVRAGRQEQLVELLLDGVVGVTLIAWPDPSLDDLELLFALRERAVLAASPSHPLARGPLDADRVAAESRPFLVMRWWPTLPPPLAALAARAQPYVELPMGTAMAMVLRGAGAGFFPWMQVAEPIAQGRLVELPVAGFPALTRDSALVRRPGAPALSPAATALVAAIKRRAEGLGLLIG